MQQLDDVRPAPPCVLTIAGSDSGGGAGIQADLHTFAAFGTHGLSAITAVTAQNTRGVEAIHMLPLSIVRAQLAAIFTDFPVAAIKIGMLGTPAIARLVAGVLAAHADINVVLDPVMIATTGGRLSRDGLTSTLRRHLLASASVITPNIPEAEQLLAQPIAGRGDMLDAARALQALGARAVVLKGGHLYGATVSDLLLDAAGHAHWFEHPRIAAEGHGTGCTLSSAIAAGLAQGRDLVAAVRAAADFVHAGLAGGYQPGKGDIRVLAFG